MFFKNCDNWDAKDPGLVDIELVVLPKVVKLALKLSSLNIVEDVAVVLSTLPLKTDFFERYRFWTSLVFENFVDRLCVVKIYASLVPPR